MTLLIASISIAHLPAIGAELDGGIFAGLTTSKSGMHHAVVLLPEQGTDLTWKQATKWAEELHAELPSRPIAAMLFHNLKEKLQPRWHWTNETYEGEASYAWFCDFDYGDHDSSRKSDEGSAVAVRCIPVTA
jgi:hypothetical protein